MAQLIIAPGIQDTDVSNPLTFPDKVKLFRARMLGWKLDIADAIINGYITNSGIQVDGIPEAGYAALDVMFTYFEPIGKYIEGYTADDQSGVHFKKGIHSVFPNIARHSDPKGIEFVESTLWKAVRCGIYHAGMTKGSVAITGDIEQPIAIPSDYRLLFINPHILIKAIKEHLIDYCSYLEKSGNSTTSGKNFEKRFDFDNK
jgi:hypothetical protein